MENIAFDSHKGYTLCSVEDRNGRLIDEFRICHQRGQIRERLSEFSPGSPVAVETIGNWYWIVDEIEEAGMRPRLVHAHKAKVVTDRVKVGHLGSGENRPDFMSIVPIMMHFSV